MYPGIIKHQEVNDFKTKFPRKMSFHTSQRNVGRILASPLLSKFKKGSRLLY